MSSTKSIKRQTVAPEELTVGVIRDAIAKANPSKDYFKQDTLKSFTYLCRDLTQVAVTTAVTWYGLLPALEALTTSVNNPIFTAVAYFVAYNLFWFIQGLNCMGIWVLAHECGHRAFSPYLWVNDAIGMVLHSALLVPYHNWRISHGNHHKHTNHLEKDTVFVPAKLTSAAAAAREAITESPLVATYQVIIMLTVGWPGYLILNTLGPQYGRRTNHFEPSSPLFRFTDRPDIVASDLALAAVVAVLGCATYAFGAANVMFWYGMPYLWVNAWLVFITYMQHWDVRVAHYAPEQWNFVRGALGTVDRNFGAPLNWWLHHINDSHVVHHLFSTMPFYNAIEVTRKYIKPILKDCYVEDERPLYVSLYESWTNCHYVVPSEGIAWFKK